MLRTVRFVFAALVAIAVASQAATAFAAPSGWDFVDVIAQSDQQRTVLLVSGQLPESTKLPAKAELAVPAGTQLQWIGEILGGDPSKDPELKYTKTTAEGVDVYSFTLTQARIAQIEAEVPGAGNFDGTNYTPSIKWTAWRDLPEVRISQRVPQGSKIVQAAPEATLQPGGSGFSYYTKTIKAPKAGDVIELAFAYSAPAAGSAPSGTQASTGSSSDSAVVVIILAVFVLGLGAVAYSVQRKLAAKTAARAQGASGKESSSARSAASASAKSKAAQATADAGEDADPPAPSGSKLKPKPVMLTVAVVGILVVGAVIAGANGSSTKVSGGKITKFFGATSPCSSATVPITAAEGVDLDAQGAKLVDAFSGKEGVGDVTLDLGASKVDVAFCDSYQSEQSVRQILASTGLVTLGDAQPAAAADAPAGAAKVDASGKKQTATIDTATGSFSPAKLVLKAGVPAEITFGQATGCMSEVVSDKLGVKQDLTAGPATVKLGALEPGSYPFECGMGHQEGEIVVQ